MVHKTKIVGALVVGAVLWTGCPRGDRVAATPDIQEDWLARVPSQEMTQVEQARMAQRQARDELNRAEVQVQDMESERDVARANRDAARAAFEAAESRYEGARNTGEQMRVQQAEQQRELARMEQDVADKQVELAEARVSAAEARRDLAQARVDTREAQVKQAEYQTLRQRGDTRVEDIDPTEFERAIADRRNRESELEMQVRDQDREIASIQQDIEQLRSELQARQNGISPAG